MNVLQILRYRLSKAIADQNKFFLDSFLARVELFEHAPNEAILTTLRDLFPILIFACGIIFLFWKPQAQVDPSAPPKPPKQPRVVLRPGSRASVEYNKSLVSSSTASPSKLNTLGETEKKSIAETTSMMSAPSTTLPPPLDTPIPRAQLSEHTGADPAKPILVAIKGTVFDVTAKREMYGPGGSYSVFAGKDGSKGLGMSSLKPEDAVADYSGLDDKQTKTLLQWQDFFTKRYPIVGKVVD